MRWGLNKHSTLVRVSCKLEVVVSLPSFSRSSRFREDLIAVMGQSECYGSFDGRVL